MTEQERDTVQMRAISDQLWEFVQARTGEGGDIRKALLVRCSAIAFLAHSLGLGPLHVLTLSKAMEDYTDNCNDQNCSARTPWGINIKTGLPL